MHHLENARRVALRPLLLTLLLGSLAACGDPTTSGQTDTGTDLTDVLPDVAADTDDASMDAEDGSGDATDATDASDVAETDVDPGGDVGDPCELDADCATGECVVLAGGVPGICTSFCSTGADCPEGFDCILLTNSGADAASLCIPRDYCADADGDRFGVGPGCLGIDCDDSNDAVNFSADELCDGIDNDCDGLIDENAIDVGDDCVSGYPGPCGPGRLVCQAANIVCEPRVVPSDELCDGVDNNCDGLVDNDPTNQTTWYRDADGDRFGDPDDSVVACDAPEGYIAADGDCDDTRRDVNPTVTEVCDGIDNDCNDIVDSDAGEVPLWYADIDADGFGDGAAVLAACAQPEGYVANPLDCDDTNDAVNPDATEVCNGIDDNCRDGVDENSAADASTWYRDADSDTWGSALDVRVACVAPEGYIARVGDCDDTNDAVNPGATEVCNGVDDNCRDGIDEGVLIAFYRDADADGWGNAGDVVLACSNPGGRVTLAGDCDDANFRRNPGLSERCDGIDNNCDGTFTSIDRRGRTVEYDASCQNFGGSNANDLCFGEAWNGQGYMHCHYHQSWDQARSVCQARGMDLADINSAEENAAVIGAFNGQDGESWDDLWIGGRETGTVRFFQWIRTGSVFWQNGSVGLYANWRSGEPSNDSGGANNDCTSVYQSDFRWNDRSCGGSIEFICEW